MKLILGFVLLLSVTGSAYFFKPFGKKIDYYQVAQRGIQKYHPSRKDYVIVIDYSKNIFQKLLLFTKDLIFIDILWLSFLLI